MQRKLQNYIALVFKGMAMGAADVVPGVSGGTIAFITGIYEELLNSIKSINLQAFKILFKEGIPALWKHINGNFLIAVGFGIILSVLSLAKALQELLVSAPILLWSFFFGLIIASAITVGKKITSWDIINGAALVVGIIIAFFITSATPATTPDAYWFVFLAGAIAICAMILPGISGSFILLIMGKYEFILNALTSFKIDIIAVFIAGAGIGILSFSNLLSWLLKKFHNATTAILTGFMIGSLYKVWPWKNTTEWITDRHGELKPLIQENISPFTYTELTQNDHQLWMAVLLAVVGFVIIILFDKVITEEK